LSHAGRRAFFFDRDGTLIADRGYIRKPADVELLPGVVHALTELRRRGFLLVVVSNQSGIGRGLSTEAEARAVADQFREVLEVQGIGLDAVYYCPHAPGVDCDCRKPKPGMLLKAARHLDVDLARSYMVGDKWSDCEAGEQAGCTPVLIRDSPPFGEVPGGWIVIRNISDLVQMV
jgi:D-glycero-D-manno-heptose 1,7-bisphosphate phosphatase